MIKRWTAAFFAVLAFFACELGEDVSGGTEIPNELVGREVIAGGAPAVDAEVRIIPVGYQPGAGGGNTPSLPTYTLRTDSSGIFKLVGALPGQYNILAVKDGLKSYRDSVAITEVGRDLGTDTLRPPGTLHGKVVLQPDHDPRSAVVQVLGTQIYVNVDSAGSFVLPDLAQGKYRLQVETSLPGYTALFASAEVRSGESDTLPDLKPFYALIPVVTGLKAVTTSEGHITLTWDPTSYLNVDSYLIYRDSAGALLPAAAPMAKVEGTRFSDTLYAEIPDPDQYPLTDSTVREFTYRVRLLTRGGDVGPAYAKATAVAYSRVMVAVSTAWRQVATETDFSMRAGAAVIEFKDRLWVIGGYYKSYGYHDVWSSEDGLSWNLEQEALPGDNQGLCQVASFQEKLWVMTLERREGSLYPTCYASPDGRAWTRIGGLDMPVEEAPPQEKVMQRAGVSLAAFRDNLWLIGGLAEGGAHSSPDGIAWSPVSLPDSMMGSSNPAVVAHNGRLWFMGGSDTAETSLSARFWTSPDGKSWTQALDSAGLLPRLDVNLVSDGKNLFAIGGMQPIQLGSGGVEMRNQGDQVWIWNGKQWRLFDSHAPFGRRVAPGVGSFQGKVRVIGGLASPESLHWGDVWMMEYPGSG